MIIIDAHKRMGSRWSHGEGVFCVSVSACVIGEKCSVCVSQVRHCQAAAWANGQRNQKQMELHYAVSRGERTIYSNNYYYYIVLFCYFNFNYMYLFATLTLIP
jgi:hypothetical protein